MLTISCNPSDPLEHEDFYFASLGGGLMLDAKKMGSAARFANHSCNPNCVLQKWNVLGKEHIASYCVLDVFCLQLL